MDKVLPQIRQSGGYAALLINGSTTLGDGSRAYRVDVSRIDRVLDSICHATFYAHFRTRFDDNKHVMHHRYPNFTSADVEANTLSTSAQGFIEQFSQLHPGMSQPHSLEVNDQPVYSCNVVAPVGKEGSITIHHTFFGIFNVVSFLTRQWDADIAEVLQQAASVVLGQRGK